MTYLTLFYLPNLIKLIRIQYENLITLTTNEVQFIILSNSCDCQLFRFHINYSIYKIIWTKRSIHPKISRTKRHRFIYLIFQPQSYTHFENQLELQL